MKHLIDKAAVVAEIEIKRDRIRKGIFSIPLTGRDRAFATFEYEILGKIKDFLDTLEVKDVDLEKELNEYGYHYDYVSLASRSELINFAKHFFELGLKAQSKDMIEALRTEYEKGRADVIADTLSWLENCWSKYCSNQTIIEGYKEAIQYE